MTALVGVEWGTVPAWGAVLGAVAAAIAIVVQRHNSRLLGRIERTVALHRDLTTGEVGASRDRFTELMWREGSHTQPGQCHQPCFAELLDAEFTRDSVIPGRGALARYPDDVAQQGASPSRDLYKVLWCFERIDALLASKQLDAGLAVELLGTHTVWWNSLCARISDADTMHRRALGRAAEWMTAKNPSLRTYASQDFRPGDPARSCTNE